MANEGGSSAERAISFIVRLVVSLIIPAWGVVMLVLGLKSGEGWWIAIGSVVILIGVIFLGGSSLATAFISGGRGNG
jgi:hypothetical protein